MLTRVPNEIETYACGSQRCRAYIAPFGDAYEKIGTDTEKISHGSCTRMTRCFRVVDLQVSIFILLSFFTDHQAGLFLLESIDDNSQIMETLLHHIIAYDL